MVLNRMSRLLFLGQHNLVTITAVNFICDDPTIQAISFVGSDQAGQHIYERGAKAGKRVQSNMVSFSASSIR